MRGSEDEAHRPPTAAVETEGVNGRYQRLFRLGGGGMADVFAVLDQQSDRRVALKRPQPARDSDQTERVHELFAREFHTLAQLAHPRVVEVYDFGIDALGPYYTMELLDGGDLEEQKPCALNVACAIARDVCSALSFLHSRRIVHRDVSPRNVRCTSDGLAKLIDFGVMARMGPNKLLLGTPLYCAPEVLYMQALDGRTDLYALGATLYYVLTGQHAYPARSFADLPNAWKRELRRPSELTPGISEAMDELVLDLLQLSADLRPRSAGEVMERLSLIEGRTFQEHDLVARAYLSTPAFVGRELELARVRSKAMRASNARGGALLIRAPDGVGRSRFLDASSLAAKLNGMMVVRADAEDAAHSSFGMFRRFAQQLLQLMPELPASLNAQERALLGQVIPELAQLPADIAQRVSEPVPSQKLSSAAQIQDAARRLILAAASINPLLIAVDDVDRADEASLVLLAVLARAADSARLLIVATQVDPAEQEHATARPMALELFVKACNEQQLSRFTLPESQSLLQSLFGQSAELDRMARRLHVLSSGRPRDLMRLCQHLMDTHVARYENGSWVLSDLSELQLPRDLTQLLAARSHDLSAPARELACALSLCADQRFSFAECLRLTGQLTDAELVRALDELMSAGIVSTSDDAYMASDRAWGAVLTSELTADQLRSLQLRLAAVFEQRPRGTFRRVQHLLAAGDNAHALDVFVKHAIDSVAITDRDPDEFRDVLRAMPGDWMQTYARAIEVCRELGRPLREEHALRVRWAGIVTLLGVRGDPQLSVLISQVQNASPLREWAELPSQLPAAERFARALERARARHAAQPEAARLMDPLAAAGALAEAMRFVLGVSATRYDVAAVRSLPSLEPFFALSPTMRVIENLVHGVHARLTGRVDEACALYRRLLSRISEPDRAGLNESGTEFTRLLVLSALSMLEASLGLPSALERAAEVEQNAVFQVNGMLIRMLCCLYRGDLAGADQCQKAVDMLRLQHQLRQSFEHGYLAFQLQVYVALEDVPRLKHSLSDVAYVAGLYAGWKPVLAYGRAELQRMRGDAHGALATARAALREMAAGDHQLWPQLVAAEVRALDAAGQSKEAADVGRRALEQSLMRLGPSACLPLWLTVGVVQARAGIPGAAARVEGALAHLTALGATGLWIALAHEARAWVAIAEQDRAGFELALSCLETERNALPGGVLNARVQKLKREAARRDLGASAALNEITDLGFDDRDALEASLRACKTRAERGQQALSWLSERCGASAGHLFEVVDREPIWIASAHQVPPDAETYDAARRHLNSELSLLGQSTGAGIRAPAVSGAVTRDDGYRPVLLSHQSEGARVITGLVIFILRAGQLFVFPGEAAGRLSRVLYELDALATSRE